MYLLKFFGRQQYQRNCSNRWMVRFISQFASLVAFAFILTGCSKENAPVISSDTQLRISPSGLERPPGLERLRRMIDTTTLEARVVVTAASDTQSIAATAANPSEVSRTASVQVPSGVPFSIEVIWSALGVNAIRVDYAIFREVYSAIANDISLNVSSDQYDMSAAAFDSDNDGISNFEELVAGTPAAGDLPIADSAAAYYPLDFGQAIDSSGNNRNGTVIGGVAAADENGVVDSAMRLGASMEHVSLPAGVVDGLRDFTIMFKVNFDTFNEGDVQYNTIFSVASEQNHEIVFAYGHNETFFPFERRFYLASDGGGNIPAIVLFEQINTIMLNSWHCVALYRSGGSVGLIVDEELIGDGEVEFTSAAIRADEGGFIIGQSQLGNIGGPFESGKALAGIVDEFYVFDSPLELEDVQDFCN